MPIGPSHAGRGSGGGSSRGGLSGSSSSHGGGSFRRSSGPRSFHFFGRTVIVSSGVSAILSVLFFFIFFTSISIFGFSSAKSTAEENIKYYKTQMAVMESDAVFFEDLIEKAKNGEDGYYLSNANFGNMKYNIYPTNPTTIGSYNAFTDDVTTWYFIVYEYVNEHSVDPENPLSKPTYVGTTYTQFSSSQISGMNGKIQVAYTFAEDAWWSINTSFSLENNKDYAYTKSQLEDAESALKSSKNTVIAAIVILVGLIAVVGILIYNQAKKAKKKSEAEKAIKEAELAEATARAQEAQQSLKNKNRKCAFCGSKIADGQDQCPGCGSRDFK